MFLALIMKSALIVLLGVVGAFAGTSNELSWRIVGGAKAADGQFPYQISLRKYGSHSCGGSIIDETTILCAAHCVQGASPSSLKVAVGINKLNDKSAVVYDVKSIVVHADYDAWVLQNDISIIKLSKPIQFNAKVQPVKLRQNEIGGDEEATLSGWGSTYLWGDTPNDLQFIKLNTLTVQKCKELQTSYEIVPSEVCTLTKRGEGACHGDSGGPLVDSNGEQIGIVSWGTPCAQGEPDVFTRVTSFLDWIEKNR